MRIFWLSQVESKSYERLKKGKRSFKLVIILWGALKWLETLHKCLRRLFAVLVCFICCCSSLLLLRKQQEAEKRFPEWNPNPFSVALSDDSDEEDKILLKLIFEWAGDELYASLILIKFAAVGAKDNANPFFVLASVRFPLWIRLRWVKLENNSVTICMMCC